MSLSLIGNDGRPKVPDPLTKKELLDLPLFRFEFMSGDTYPVMRAYDIPCRPLDRRKGKKAWRPYRSRIVKNHWRNRRRVLRRREFK